MTALLLLLPGTPMLFQGQEFAASAPFLYFADLEPELAAAVRTGRGRVPRRSFPSVARLTRPQRARRSRRPRRRSSAASSTSRARARTRAAYALHVDLLRAAPRGRRPSALQQRRRRRRRGAVARRPSRSASSRRTTPTIALLDRQPRRATCIAVVVRRAAARAAARIATGVLGGRARIRRTAAAARRDVCGRTGCWRIPGEMRAGPQRPVRAGRGRRRCVGAAPHDETPYDRPIRRTRLAASPTRSIPTTLVTREWLVTNGTRRLRVGHRAPA